MEHISERIYRVRVDQGLTQRALANQADMSQQNITAYETRRSIPSSGSCRKLARAFGLTLAEFEEGADFTKSTSVPSRRLRRSPKNTNPHTANLEYPAESFAPSPPSPSDQTQHIDSGAAVDSASFFVSHSLSPKDVAWVRALCDELLASAHNHILIVTDIVRCLDDPRGARPRGIGADQPAGDGAAVSPLSQKA